MDGNGIFRTLEAKITSDAGPYTGLSGGVLEQGCIFALGPYRIDAAKLHAYTVRTNTVQGGAFRGFGINQSANWHRNDDRRGGRAAGDRSLRDSSPQRGSTPATKR